MKIYYTAWLLLSVLLFVNVVDAQSQPPTPSTGEIISDPQSHADKTTKRSGTNQRGTKDNPFIIDIVKTKYDDERTDQESKDAHQSAADNRHLVIITGVLAIFACFQWLVMLWQGCLSSAQIKLSRQEFIISKRPRMIVRRIQIHCEEGKKGIEFVLVNTGDSAATILPSNFNIAFIETNNAKIFEKQSIPLYNNTLIPIQPTSYNPGVAQPIFIASEAINDAAMNEVITRKKILYFFGRIRYQDAIGNDRRTGFFRTYDFSTKRFEASKDEDYEYN